MNNDIFRRVEQKYILSKEEYQKLFKKINSYLEKDEFYESKICNIYFDSVNNDMIINSLEKPIYKDKVRLRSYGIPSKNDTVYLEIKNKYKGIVGKRRIKMTLDEYYNYYYNHECKDKQIMKEIDYLFNFHHLIPNMFIAYDRLSYKAKDDENLRITIDSNLRSRKNDLQLELGDYGDKYFTKDTYIMEIKTLNVLPLWLVRILNELKIYPESFSKYGSIYEKEMKEMV